MVTLSEMKKVKQKNDVLAEQMTVWQEKKSKTATSSYSFKVHDKNRQMWREFGSLFCKEVNTHLPGNRFDGMSRFIES